MIDSAPNPLMNWEIINKYGFVVNAPANKAEIIVKFYIKYQLQWL